VLIDYLEGHSGIVALAERILTALAMYRAKEHGKDRFEEFRDHMHTAIVERLELEADLRRTMGGNQELVVYYQPVIDLTTGAIIGFEALVRWQHPLRGLLAPGSFVPLRRGGRADRRGRPLRARRGLRPTALLARTRPHRARNGDQCQPLSARVDGSGVLDELRTIGVRLSVDDFGTGYSSLAYLEQFPVDILKIDRSFVTALSDDDPAGLAQAIIQIAETLGLMTVAEGVESAEQAERLRALGCRAAQGYHLGMPLDAHETEEMLRTHGALMRSSPPR
jgi:EAL domain-containing protein (putative c-di-GMP-specific phosphodiesterase class I)